MGLLGLLTHSGQRAIGVGRSDRGEVERTVGVGRHRDRPATGQDRAHLVGRVRHRRIQHGVAVGSPQAQPLRQRPDELLGPDAGADLGDRHGDVEAPTDPPLRRGAQLERTDARRVPAFGARRAQGGEHRVRWRIDRGADREVDQPAVESLGERLEPVEAVVRIRGRHEAGTVGDRRHVGSSLTGSTGRRHHELRQPPGRRVREPGADAHHVAAPRSSRRPRPRGGRRRARRRGRTARRARRPRCAHGAGRRAPAGTPRCPRP